MSFANWDFSCVDWAERLKAGKTPIADLPLDLVEAEVAVSYYNKLRLPDVRSQPTLADASGEWFRDLVRAAFGSVVAYPNPLPDAPDNTKLYRHVGELFILVPKKNNKTTGSSSLGIVWLLMNETPNVDGVIIGPTQEIAQKCFDQAANMIRLDPYLEKRFRIIEHKKTIVDTEFYEGTTLPRNAKLKIKSFDTKVVTGSIPAFAIIDELHLMSESHYATRVIGQIRGGMITNDESLLIFITTQSEEPPSGIFKSELDYARAVRDGRITKNVRMLPVLYEFPEEIQTSKKEDWQDPKLWPMVLPNLGRSVHLPRLIQEYGTAVDKGPEEKARWLSQHLNIQIGMGLHFDRWIGADYWLDTADRSITLETLIVTSDVCVVGIDGGGLDDLLGLAVIGRHKETKQWRLWNRAWAHKKVLERRPKIAEKLRDFASDGDLIICKDPSQDLQDIGDICEQLNDAGMLPERGAIGLDPEGVAAIVDELALRGIDDEQMAAVSQGYKLNSAIKGSERKLFDGSLVHADQPLMDWCVGNAKTEPRGNAIVVTKAISGSGKIDPLMAFFNGVTLMSRNPTAKGQTVYGARGALVI